MVAVSSLARQQQRDQQQLFRLLTLDLTRIWPNLLLLGLPAMVAAIAALIEQFASASASLAAEWYELERDNAGARTRFTVPVAETPPLEQVEAVVSWATRQLRSGRAADELDVFDPAKLGDLVDLDALRESRTSPDLPGSVGDPQVALSKMAGAAQKMVADTGRETIARAVDADQFARGWVRVPTGAYTCPFCAMMCARSADGSATYKNRATAGGSANDRFVGAGEFKFHSNCDCIAVPILSGQVYEPDEQIKQWDALYRKSTRDASGTKGKLAAFRKAYQQAYPASPDEPTEGQG